MGKPKPLPLLMAQMIGSPVHRKQLITLADERQMWATEMKQAKEGVAVAKEQLERIDGDIGGILDKYKLSKSKMVLPSGNILSAWIGSSSFINGGKLLNAGVDPDTILECTDVTEYPVIKVSTPDEDAKVEEIISKRGGKR